MRGSLAWRGGELALHDISTKNVGARSITTAIGLNLGMQVKVDDGHRSGCVQKGNKKLKQVLGVEPRIARCLAKVIVIIRCNLALYR